MIAERCKESMLGCDDIWKVAANVDVSNAVSICRRGKGVDGREQNIDAVLTMDGRMPWK